MQIITITGPSCAGKTTLLNTLLKTGLYSDIISHTTRPMRVGEVNGVDYHFVTTEEFNSIKDNAGFVETVEFSGYFYGGSISEIDKVSKTGKTAVIIVEPLGMLQIRKYCSSRSELDFFSVYISGKLENLLTRYISRMNGEDLSVKKTAENHARRITSLTREVKEWDEYSKNLIGGFNLIFEECNKENESVIVKVINNLIGK